MEIDGVRLPFVPIGGVETLNRPTNQTIPSKRSGFQEIFEAEISNLKFSAHAKSRLTSREINLSFDEIEKLEKAVKSAESKGGRESLVIFPDKSFLVSVQNRTIITVFSNEKLQDKVITNIDSVVFGY
ncbi:MAG: flagellar protein [Ignavibacteria bacterium]|nr:flagellar protein [Ignavibacteria bacterium]